MAVQNEKLARNTETLEARLAEIIAQLEAAESARASLTEKEAALSADAQFAGEENARLKLYGEELAQRNSELLGERDELRGQVDQLGMKLQWLDGEKAELQSTLGMLEGDKTRLENSTREQSQKLSNLYAELERAAAENAQLSQSLDEHKNRGATVGSERDELHRRVDELQTNLKWVGGEKTALESERDNLRRRADELQGNLQSIASEKSRLESELNALTSQVAESSAEREHLAAENGRLQKLVEELRNEISSLCTEREHFSGQAGDFQSQLQSLAEEKSALEAAHHALRAELDSSRERTERLERELETATAEKAVVAAESAALATECDRLRGEHSNVADLEQRLSSALDDREHTSSELYRALLQLSEMQERDDHHKAFASAHATLNDALEKSTREVTELTEQIERLSAQHAEAEAARLELAQQQSATAEAQVRYANEKSSLEETAAELRAELMEACEREAKYVAQLRVADDWRQKYEAAARNESALAESLADLELRLAGKQQSDDEAASLAAEREQKVAEYERLLAEASESIGQLQRELAVAVEARSNVELSRDLWENERAGWRQQQAEFHSQIADLKAELVESLEALAAQRTRVVEVPTSDQNTSDCSEFRTENDRPSESVESMHDSNDEQLHESKADQSTSLPGPFDRVVREREATQGPVGQAPQTSFIEQYSHMFADDKPSIETPVASPDLRSPSPEELSQTPRNQVSVGGNAATPPSDDDESLEQYMAKLMQRVRGDSTPAAASAKPSTSVQKPVSSGPLGYESPPIQSERPMSLSAISLRDSVSAGDATPADAPLRKSMPTPQTDLEALRALANESARRAISRHSIRKYRRNATTKLIVSTLAAMTSVWLMLESPSWMHWQFLAACGIILIAVYWTGRTLRALVETLRAAAPDETEKEIREISAELQARLPVDVLEDTTPVAT
jgi:chromosome segregation ATPase